MYPPLGALGLSVVNVWMPTSIVGAMFESAAVTTLRWEVWSPSNRAAIVRKFSAAVTPPPALTVLIGTDQDFVTALPAVRVTDSNPLLFPLSNHFCQTW